MDTNREKPDKTLVYLPEDRELILSLLKEYSEKLIDVCNKIYNDNGEITNYSLDSDNFVELEKSKERLEKLKEERLERLEKLKELARRRIIILTYIGVGFAIFVSLSSFIVVFFESIIIKYGQLIFGVVLGSCLLGIYSFFNSFFNNVRFEQEQKFLKQSSRTIALKLKKIIRVASQIDEHIETSLGKRIELDLRLTDAESALEYYELVTGVNRKKKP